MVKKNNRFKLDLKPILTTQHKGSCRRISYSLRQFCVSLSPQCWCTRFRWLNCDKQLWEGQGEHEKEKTSFGLSVPTIFVWDCSSIAYLHRSARWTRNNARQLWNTRFSVWSLFSFWPVFLYSYCWPCWSCTCINTYFKLKSGVLFLKRDFKSSWSAC